MLKGFYSGQIIQSSTPGYQLGAAAQVPASTQATMVLVGAAASLPRDVPQGSLEHNEHPFFGNTSRVHARWQG